MDYAFYIDEYANLTKSQRDLCRILYDAEIKFRKGIYKFVRMKKSVLAGYCLRCIKTVQRFHKAVRSYLIGVHKRWNSNGNQAASRYEFDPDFFKAMQLMDSKNMLYKDKKRLLEFANSHRQNKNVPLSPSKCPSSYSSSSESGSKEYRPVHPYIEKIGGLTHQQRLSLSQYPEHAIVSGVQDVLWWWRQGNRPQTTLESVIKSRIKSYDI